MKISNTLLPPSAFVLEGTTLSASAQEIPAQLPSHDGKPGNSAKPVKVYILAGQSNMVGVGTLSGARNSYTGIYLSSDPETPAGPLDIWQVGSFKTAPLAVFNADGTPARDPIAQGSFEVPDRGVYQVQCGSGDSSFVSMEVGGKPAYSRAAGSAPVRQEVTLEPGKRHPFTITGFTGEAPRFLLRREPRSRLAAISPSGSKNRNSRRWDNKMRTLNYKRHDHETTPLQTRNHHHPRIAVHCRCPGPDMDQRRRHKNLRR